MLLSEKSTVHSLPGLEILADRVRCSHGSASSPMDEEQLFYLTSRGIPYRDAQLLVSDGFLADVINKFNSVE
jgi:Fe-S cluster assembly protein SufD